MKFKKESNDLILVIDEKYQNLSILEVFHKLYVSKKTIHLLKQYKGYKLNNHFVSIETVLKIGDILSIKAYDTGIDFVEQPFPLEIIYEDDLLCIVNKPKNTIVHPDNKNGMNTLCNYVAYYYKQTNQNHPVRYLHRIDKDTTGLMIFCKCSLLQPYFDKMIADKKIRKTYLAIIQGKLDKHHITINQPIGNDRHHKQKMIVSSTGKNALTHIHQIKTKNNYSLVECVIETGRKHQIRVHLSSINHPILGDTLYGHSSQLIDRLALHAYRLQFIHPLLDKKIDVTCDINDDMKRLF